MITFYIFCVLMREMHAPMTVFLGPPGGVDSAQVFIHTNVWFIHTIIWFFCSLSILRFFWSGLPVQKRWKCFFELIVWKFCLTSQMKKFWRIEKRQKKVLIGGAFIVWKTTIGNVFIWKWYKKIPGWVPSLTLQYGCLRYK